MPLPIFCIHKAECFDEVKFYKLTKKYIYYYCLLLCSAVFDSISIVSVCQVKGGLHRISKNVTKKQNLSFF